jgi:hypothetical protein
VFCIQAYECRVVVGGVQVFEKRGRITKLNGAYGVVKSNIRMVEELQTASSALDSHLLICTENSRGHAFSVKTFLISDISRI